LSVKASSKNINKVTLFFGRDVIMTVGTHEAVENVEVDVRTGLDKRYRR
jgi:hypothetical protein